MSLEAGKRHYSSLGLLTFSTLLLQILLTRLFSVTMWYHYAFMAISLCMFGLTLGAIAVAFALSFGLGGREAAGKHMEYLLEKLRSKNKK